MCGLVGVAGAQSANTDKVFRTLLMLDVVRGEHSTGLGAVHSDGSISLAKQVGAPHELFQDKRYDAAINKRNRVLIGHNRFATEGAVNKANAHPFEFDGVMGAHNGTLRSKWKLRGKDLYQVDSQQLYFHMSEEGLEDLMEYLEGAWALTWWDKYEERMNFLRNDERTLYWAQTPDEKTVFWASEAWMLIVAANRANVAISDPELFPIDRHISFHVNKDGAITDLTSVPMASKVKPFNYSSTTTTIKGNQEKKGNGGNESKSGGTVVQQIGTNVVELPDTSYVSSNKRIVEICGTFTDAHGGRCVTLLDTQNLDRRIRLYPRPEDSHFFDSVGQEIEIQITGFQRHGNEVYYKANPWSAKLVTEAGNQFVAEEPEMYRDHHGNQLNRESWMRKYQYCGWCLNPIDPSIQNFMFSRVNDCICDECMQIPEVKDSI